MGTPVVLGTVFAISKVTVSGTDKSGFGLGLGNVKQAGRKVIEIYRVNLSQFHLALLRASQPLSSWPSGRQLAAVELKGW